MFCINVYFSEKGRDIKNNWQDYCLLHTTQLILIAGLYEPLNVRIHPWPPETLN